jgi:hypothetical protein
MDLTSHKESDMLSVSAPTGIADAFAGCRKLLIVRSVKIAYEKVSYASVVLY